MNKIITGVVLIAVGFAAGFFVFNSTPSSNNHEAIHEDDNHAMSHEMLVEVPAGSPAPAVSLEVLEDPLGGYNAHITTSNFRFAPEHVSTEHVFGEGHAHIYVDGVKINRMYGPWYSLGALSEGTHEVSVSLNTNDHGSYTVNGVKVEDSVTVVVTPKATYDASHAKMSSLALTNRALTPETVTVTEGDSVHLMVTTDEAGEFHIAGYEIEKDMEVSGATDITFVADKAGRYTLEFHPASSMHMVEGDAMEQEDIEIGALVVNPK